MEAIQFLERVWAHTCRPGDVVFLSTRSFPDKEWKDHPFVVGDQLTKTLQDWFKVHSPKTNDVYFCPTPFTKRKRVKDGVRGSSMLWSDIDQADWSKLRPSILWESSPGRFQGLWILDREITDLQELEGLNKSLTYYIGCDKGGWDLTQVLRIPGTLNHKYKQLPTVALKRGLERVYTRDFIESRVGGSEASTAPKKTTTRLPETTTQDFAKILSRYRRTIPDKVKRLLTQKSATAGKRSDIIWYIENKLSESGLSPPEIITLIKHSVWNKYAGRRDEDKRLTTELEKIIEIQSEVPEPKRVKENVEEELGPSLSVESFSEVMGSIQKSPGWLVDGFWMKKSHGIVAGEPKSFKSTLALDLGISVASGRPFLDRFEVVNSGPVIYVQNENAKWIVQDRLAKITSSKGIVGSVRREGHTRLSIEWPENIPFFCVSQQSFQLSDPIHQKLLEKVVEEYRPQLIILDPLYLMFDGDLNSSKDLNPILTWLIELRIKYDCGIMLIHHYKKGNNDPNAAPARGGQRMLGSTTLHGWIESAWYMAAGNAADAEFDEESEDVNKEALSTSVIVDREFRGAGIHPKVEVQLRMGRLGSFEYSATSGIYVPKKQRSGKTNVDDLCNELIQLLTQFKGGLSERSITSRLGVDAKMVLTLADKLTASGVAKWENKMLHLTGKK